LTEIYTLYELDKHISMTNVKKMEISCWCSPSFTPL